MSSKNSQKSRQNKKNHQTSKYNDKKQIRRGDWICSRCQNHNFSFRQYCNRCQTLPKLIDVKKIVTKQIEIITPSDIDFQPQAIFPEALLFNYQNLLQNPNIQSSDSEGSSVDDDNFQRDNIKWVHQLLIGQ